MTRRKILTALTFVVLATLASIGSAQAQGSAAQPADPWPRQFKLNNATALVYQPQVESWENNMLNFRAVVSVTPSGSKQEILGVIWAAARTQVNRVTRIVVLEDIKLTKSNFPTLADNGASYMRALQQQSVASQRTISLDRLQAALVNSEGPKPAPVVVNNDPPQIIIAYAPSILVSISGNPIVRPVAGTAFERLINTEALMLQPQGGGNYYLHVYDGWMSAGVITGPWSRATTSPTGIDEVATSLAKTGQVDLLDGGNMQPKPSLAKATPAIYVSQTPTEMLVFQGEPSFTPIAGTNLQWATNTTADVILDTGSGNYYILVAGRWYRAPALTGAGPWTYMASNTLPADFKRIPVNSPAGVVLASVAGTPQAQEALIANSIPQTATIPLVNGPKFSPVFDGAPQFQPIQSTTLQYVVNSPTPIIRVDANTYYALTAGVWFVATSVNGPWAVATYVPPVIYTIPPSSRLYYVTYVKVYGSTDKVVYVGYTPGYMGTVVSPDGVVVYGTGYVYDPWVGTVYYPVPVTYGVMAQPVYNPAVGMAFGFAMGVTAAAMTASYYHPIYYPVYYHPGYYPYYGVPCCGSVSGNVYGQWGNTAYSGTRTYYNNYGGAYGTQASGTYTNYATGTTGSYQGGRSYNPYTGQAQAGYDRTFNTTAGGSGNVERGETYNTATGRYAYGSSVQATGAEGRTISSETGAASNPETGQAGAGRQTTVSNPSTGASKTTTSAAGAGPGGAAAGRQTTYTNPTTGKTETYGAATVNNNHYADVNGNVYKNTDDGWQKYDTSTTPAPSSSPSQQRSPSTPGSTSQQARSTGSWQSAGGDTSWADREQQARTQGEDRFNSFSQNQAGAPGSTGESRFGSGEGGSGSRFSGGGGGGWADRFGAGAGGAGRFGGGGFGGFRGRR
jgi:hypothetical protein